MKTQLFILLLSIAFLANAQVGIGTTNPQGALDVTSTNTAFIAPRVTSLEDVTDGAGGDAPNGAIVYDQFRKKTCYRVDDVWICIGLDANFEPVSTIDMPLETQDMTYIKASNTASGDLFGNSVSISDNGTYLAIGALGEDSNATGINGDQTDNNASYSGAVYIFKRTGTTWAQEAYIKASNTDTHDEFGSPVSISNNGVYLAVGAVGEDSNATGINGDQTDNSLNYPGAVYVFKRTGTTWAQEAYIKASNTDTHDEFGRSVSISGTDGSTIAVGAYAEESNATGINGNQTDNSTYNAGAVYIFKRTGATWSQQAYIKASNTEANDQFGYSVSLTNSGGRLLVGAAGEDSNATGINGDQTDNSANDSGAAYVFKRTGATWAQEAYIKASNTDTSDAFGASVCISGDGTKIAIGAINEDSNATGINGDQTDNSKSNSGAVYLFTRSGTTWSQEAYIKASNTDATDGFGRSVSINIDGTKLAISAIGEESVFRGINANQNNNGLNNSGAIYVFSKNAGVWSQTMYIKSSNSDEGDRFGISISLSKDGAYLAGATPNEDSNATGINGVQHNNSEGNSGAVYVINPL